MTFFDKKEEVLEVEMTMYGRYLLSLGKWKPVYYSFFDDDVTYDSECVGFAEDQNVIEDRIKDTSRLRSQPVYRSIEDNLISSYKQDDTRIQGTFEREYALTSKLGIADYYSDHSPAWDVSVLKGEITSSVTVHSSSGGDGPNYMIPQLNMKDITYEKIAGMVTTEGVNPQPDPYYDDDLRQIHTFNESGTETFIEIRNDFLLLEIVEDNTTFHKENFEIELFAVELESAGGEKNLDESGEVLYAESLIPLKFSGPRAHREAEYSGFYFNIDVDKEIDELLLCKYKGVETTKGLFLQGVFDCELADIPDPELRPYATGVQNVEDVCTDLDDT